MSISVSRLSRAKNTRRQLVILTTSGELTIQLTQVDMEAIETILGWYVDGEGNLYNFNSERVKMLTNLVKNKLAEMGQVKVNKNEKHVDGKTIA